MTDLRTELSALRVEVSKLAVSIATLPNRQDISGELDKRVDRATYEVAHRAMEADIRDLVSDLEEFKRRSAGTMQRAAPWVALGVAILFGLANTVVAVVGLLIAISQR